MTKRETKEVEAAVNSVMEVAREEADAILEFLEKRKTPPQIGTAALAMAAAAQVARDAENITDLLERSGCLIGVFSSGAAEFFDRYPGLGLVLVAARIKLPPPAVGRLPFSPG